MARAQGCSHVRLLLCLLFAILTLAGCSLAQPPYCPVAPVPSAPASGPGGPLHKKALEYDRWFQETLQPSPYGGVVNVIFERGSDGNPAGPPLGYDDQQDSAIWTGTYLAAQAFRYAASSDPAEKQEALRNARRAAQTLHFFLKVTGRSGLLARFAGPLAEAKVYLRGSACANSTSVCDSMCPPVEDGDIEVFPGVDYLVAYWMGRYHGFLKPES